MKNIFNGPSNSITDIDGFLVGNAHDGKLKSGVTVLTRSTSFRASVSILGGAPGTKETDLLSPDKIVDNIDGIVLAVGSAFWYFYSDTVPDWWVNILPYVIVIIVLIFFAQRLRMPAANGQIYRRGQT